MRASSPIPQSASFAVAGRSSSEAEVRVLLLLLDSLCDPELNPELLELVSSLLKLDAYSGGSSEIIAAFVAVLGFLYSAGVGEGVISVLDVTSTSSASRYHFLRLVYLSQPS